MKKITFLFFVLFEIVGNVNGQVPGMIGKRFSIGGGVHMNPIIKNKNTISPWAVVGLSGNLEFTLSRKSSFYLNADYNVQKCNMVDYSSVRITTSSTTMEIYPFADNYSVLDDLSYIKGQVLQFSGGFKFYKGNFVSPIGRYVKVGVSVTSYGPNKVDDLVLYYSFYGNHSRDGIVDLDFKSTKSQNIGLNLGLGKTVVLNKSLVVDFALDTNIPILHMGEYVNLTPQSSYYSSAELLVMDTIWKKIRFRELIQGSVSFRFLL